MDQDR